MADLSLKSESQLKADIFAQLSAELGINDFNAGSVIEVLVSAVAQEGFAQYIQMARISRLKDIEQITDEDLDNYAFEFGLTRQLPVKATGNITIQRPASFTKVSTGFYSGSPNPIIGNTSIDVNDASDALYSTTGTLILGKDTSSEEEVAYSIGPVDNTNFWTFTLDSGLAFNHSIDESVILKQGSDETIIAGTQINVPATGVSAAINFTLNNDVVVDAGEEEELNVEVTAVIAGETGNIPANAISGAEGFTSEPFTGARALNSLKFTTGLDKQTDDSLRDGIKNHIQSLSRGVKEAILNALVGLVDPDTAKRIVSASIILPQDECGVVTIYIDDGLGLEPTFSNQGFETVLGNSTGGESRLTLDTIPLIKAQVECALAEPYDFSGGSKTLIVEVAGVSETITFDTADFEFVDAGTAEEVVAVINNDSSLLEARTSQVGTQVVITSRSETNERIMVTGGTSSAILNFPTDEKHTLFLYVDDVLQSKDGKTALIDSGNTATYDFLSIGAFPHTITVVVDGKTANTQTVTFNSGDFLDTNACTASEVIAVINAQLSGAVASVESNNTLVRITSNTDLSISSIIQITGGTANDATNGLNFSTTAVTGEDGDYTLNRQLGTVELNTALTANQSVTAGSQFTRAKLRAGLAENYAPATGETLVISIDGGANQTITFDGTFVAGKSAQLTADFINLTLVGGLATVREVGVINYLEISTNTYTEAVGTIEIKGATTANSSFTFSLDSLQSNQRPHKAFAEAANSGTYDFAENDTLIVVVDDDIVNNTFVTTMDYDGDVTTSNSTTVFRISSFTAIFPSDDDLNSFVIGFTDGANTTTGAIDATTDQTGDVWRYAFDALPTGLANFAAGDLIEITGMTNTENNGNFIISAVNTGGFGYIEVTNASGIAETVSPGTCTLGQRRTVSDYTAATGEVTVSVAFTTAPALTENAIVLPSTIGNVNDFFNNIKITSLGIKANMEISNIGAKLQISSQQDGSDGDIQVTGGAANLELGFATTIVSGLQAYSNYTGIIKLAHLTVYGDDTDLVTYPGIGAAGIQFDILAPTINDLSVTINVTLAEGISISSLENEIKSAITNYVNTLGVGEDVIIEEIKCAVLAISGITDILLTAPSANIAIADNELSIVKIGNISVS